MVDSSITLTGSRLVLKRLEQLHSYDGQTIGSSIFIRVDQNLASPDRLLFLPNNFLLLIFEAGERTQWVMIKTVSEYWQNFTKSIYNTNESTPFFSPPLRKLRLDEQQALSNLFDRIRVIYCVPTSQDLAEMGRGIQDFFGENELSTAHNEAVKKYMEAKREYESILEKYNRDAASYEREMKEYEARLKEAKLEYEKYVKDMEEYGILKQKYDAYIIKLKEYERKSALGQVKFSNLKAIYDFAETGKIYFVDQDNGYVAFEHRVHTEFNKDTYKRILYDSRGFDIRDQIIVGSTSELFAGTFPLGPSDIVPVANSIKLSIDVLDHYGIKEYDENEVHEPTKPKAPESIESPDITKPEFTATEPILERELIPMQDLNEVDYTRGLTTCPAQLAKGVFDFGEGSSNVNSYVIDAPNATGVSNWMLLTGGECFKCNGWKNSWVTELYTPDYPVSLRILRITGKVGSLTSNIATPDRDQILANTYRAFDLALKGKILNNELSFLGKEGFTYQKSKGVSVLNLKGQEVTYDNGSLPANSLVKFNEWQKLFCRYPLELNDLRMDDAILHELFEDVAEGKHHWIEYYRQTPLAFLAKYCQINVSN